MKHLTTMQQVNKYRRLGQTIWCTYPGVQIAEVKDIRYGQGAFQVKVVGSDEWISPSGVWVGEEKRYVSDVPGLWDIPRG